VPSSRINPQARFYLNHFIPLPNEGERLFRQLLLDRAFTRQLTARIDTALSESDSISAVVIRTSSVVSNGTEVLPLGSCDDWSTKNRNLTLRETHSFCSRAISQLTFTLADFAFTRDFVFPGVSGHLPEEAGFTGVHPQTNRFPGFPAVTFLSGGIRIND